jgi:uncharacterized protein YjbI with pentapeptide repeats
VLEPRLPSAFDGAAPDHLADEVVWERVEIDADHELADSVGAVAAHVEVIETALTGVQLTAGRLSGFRVADSRWEGVDASGLVADGASLVRVELVRCRLSGIDLGGARMTDVRFVECRMDEANLRMLRGERVTFEACDLRGAELIDARLPGASLVDCDLSGADLSGADLSGGRINGSTVDTVKGASSLRGVTIDPLQVLPLGARLLGELGIVVDDD